MEHSYSNSQLTLVTAVKHHSIIQVVEAFEADDLKIDENWFDYKLLTAALEREDKTIINLLIKNRCRVRRDNGDGSHCTPLHYAIRLNDVDIIKRLLKRGAYSKADQYNENSALYLAVKEKKFSVVDLILSSCDFESADPTNENDLSHFHVACMISKLEIIKKCIKRGFPVNGCYADWHIEEWRGFTPLHFAVMNKSSNSFKFLLKHGANLSAKNYKGWTPLHLAHYVRRTFNIKDALKGMNQKKLINVADDTGLSIFHICCIENIENVVQIFLDSDVDIDSLTLDSDVCPGSTALHYAVRYYLINIVELLLQHGASVVNTDKEGSTVLHLACRNLFEPVIQLLLEHGARLDIQDNKKCTPLHIAFYAASIKDTFVDLLITKIPLETNFTDSRGLSHFHIACTRNVPEKVQMFLKHGVSADLCVNSDDDHWSGFSALHFAVYFNRIDIVKLLLEHRANVSATATYLQMTPLHIACVHEIPKFYETVTKLEIEHRNVDWSSYHKTQIEIIELLVNHKAEVNAPDSSGKTPLFYVFQFPVTDTVVKLDAHFYNFWSYCPEVLTEFEDELHEGISRTQREIIRVLLKHDADIHHVCANRASVLHVISRNRKYKEDAEVAELLLEEGVDVNVANMFGETPLHVAVQSLDNKDLVEVFLKYNANVDAKTSTGQTPLHIAFVHWNDSAIMQLLRHGADISSEDFQNNPTIFPFNQWLFDGLRSSYVLKIFESIETHLKKLVALKFHVSERIKECFSEMYSEHKHTPLSFNECDDVMIKCNQELEKLKLIKLDNYTSLYDILYKDQNEMAKHIKNESLKSIITDDSYENNFPLYNYLLKLQYSKGLVRDAVLKRAKYSLELMIGLSLPEFCSEQVLRYLTNEHMENLIEATSANDLHGKKSEVLNVESDEPVPKQQRLK